MNRMQGMDRLSNEYGMNNRYLNTAGNPVAGSSSINDQFMRLNAMIGGADVSMILHMLSQRSDTDLLSAPKVTTSPGIEATIKVVTEYIYPSEFRVQISQQGTSGGSGSGFGSGDPIAIVEPQNFTMREVGVILQVIPDVSAEGNLINLVLRPQVVSEPVWKNYGTKLPKTTVVPGGIVGGILQGDSVVQDYVDLPMEQPFFNVRSVDTTVSIYNGATVVMGGLITEARQTIEDKIPFLGDLPFIGRLFRSRAEKTTKRNLLIFVTARLVDAEGRPLRLSGDDSTFMPSGGTGTVVVGDEQ
jgi:general secretion pathway protein D